MITVIVPVFNVRNYIDRCLESVVNQTCSDIEILLILGQSHDGSSKRCWEWSEKDSRIRCVEQPYGRLGSARNLGIEEARGEYITFIDSDDWWDLTFLDKLYAAIKKENAQMAMCDRYQVYFDQYGGMTGRERIKAPAMMGEGRGKTNAADYIRMIEVSTNGKLYRREVFLKNNILQPDIFGEDRAVMYYLVSKTDTIARVCEPLYYYHCSRPGSSLGETQTYVSAIDCIRYIHSLFSNNSECYEKYHLALKAVSYEIAGIAIKGINYSGSKKIKEELLTFLEENYPDHLGERHLIGSYNLRKLVLTAFPQVEEKRCQYAFSSLISMFSTETNIKVQYSKDCLRQQWLEWDLKKHFRKHFSVKKNEWLFIDFLEERFDIAEIQGSYITYSNIFCDAAKNIDQEVTIISRFDEKVTELWKEKCLEFIEFLKTQIDETHIVLVRMKLAEDFGDYRKMSKFHNIDEIRKMNLLLDLYYDYFEIHCPGIHTISPCEGETFFSDIDFRFGCAPFHVNDNFYITKSRLLTDAVVEKGKRGWE